MNFRVGFGYDIHQLEVGRICRLGGVIFDSELGPAGHSDADVLLHAICDAILGAAGLRDIGHHFPNTNETYRNADSSLLLGSVMKQVRDMGYRLGNIDATIVSEVPKIAPKIDRMKEQISGICGVTSEDVGIKATTSEGIGFIGRREGIEAYAVVLIQKD